MEELKIHFVFMPLNSDCSAADHRTHIVHKLGLILYFTMTTLAILGYMLFANIVKYFRSYWEVFLVYWPCQMAKQIVYFSLELLFKNPFHNQSRFPQGCLLKVDPI